eukprot:TRINITY_DN5937_c0_g1_i2.p1 TRINITY_DN5937_c0_g1~~TRINITY_DN5937_c0_g1_i2.p1  ORF type:complete len:536 (-),score=162.34 TRINITY_DN5937_c0_g1_i2:1155-2714(-)
MCIRDRRKAIAADYDGLRSLQEKHPDLSCLPKLRLTDIPTEVERTSFMTKSILGVPFNFTQQPTNGLTYIRLRFRSSAVPYFLRFYLPLFSFALPRIGTTEHRYHKMAEELSLYTTDLSLSTVTYTDPLDAGKHDQAIILKIACLERNLDKMFDLLGELLCQPDFGDAENTPQLLRLLSTDLSNSLVDDALSFSISTAGSGLREAYHLEQKLKNTRFLCNVGSALIRTAETRHYIDDAKYHCETLLPYLINQNNMSIWAHGSAEVQSKVESKVENLVTRFKATFKSFGRVFAPLKLEAADFDMPGDEKADDVFSRSLLRTFYALPTQVNYISSVLESPPSMHPDKPALQLLAEILSSGPLHKEVREKGGAYGAGAFCSNGLFGCWSYRDPQTLNTLSAFEKALEWGATAGNITEERLEEAKLRGFGALCQPVEPQNKGLELLKFGITDEMRENFRAGLLAATTTKVREHAAELLERARRGETSQVIFGAGGNTSQVEGLEKQGWKVEYPIEELAPGEEK